VVSSPSARLTYALFWFILVLDLFGALRLLGGGGSLRAFGPDGLAALAGSQLDSSRDAYYIGFVFNGLGSTLFALIFFQSRYVPRALALWGVLGSLYEVFCGFAYLFYPNFGAILSANSYEMPAQSERSGTRFSGNFASSAATSWSVRPIR
jgi:Domain of unknown function (DUF4386)